MKSQGAKVLIVQPFQNRRTAETVARQTGATVLSMPQQPGSKAGTGTYITMMDNLINTLAAGLRSAR
jgi:ABC-type Zn uptake system ZnuABC Zn-binding protein ZnuA